MTTDLISEAETTLAQLLAAVRTDITATEAMHLTQAAVNAAQVLMMLHNMPTGSSSNEPD